MNEFSYEGLQEVKQGDKIGRLISGHRFGNTPAQVQIGIVKKVTPKQFRVTFGHVEERYNKGNGRCIGEGYYGHKCFLIKENTTIVNEINNKYKEWHERTDLIFLFQSRGFFDNVAIEVLRKIDTLIKGDNQ